MPKTILEIKDEVNITFHGLDVATRRKLVDSVKFFQHSARHTPAFKLGRWDGNISFCDIGARSYLNLLDVFWPIVDGAGYEIDIDDKRTPYSFTFEKVDTDSYSHVIWPDGHPLAGQPIILRDHQVKAINLYLDNLTGVVVCPTAAGKTIVSVILSHKVEPYGKSVIIVPNRDLVSQTEEDYKNFGLDVGVIYGGRNEFDKTHTICTWQSIEAIRKRKDGTLDQLLDGVVCVMSDECHRCKGSVLRDILSTEFKNVPIRWGLTGTLPETPEDRTALKAVVGPEVGRIKAAELQDLGYMAKLHIHVKQLQDYQTHFKTYPEELKYLTSNNTRLAHMASMIEEISKSGNTLVLFDRIECGTKLSELIKDSVLLYGNVKSAIRKEEYKSAQFTDGKVILATYGIASTGISINRIFNLILVEPGKSFVRVIQSIGRGLRVAEDKDFVDVYDITSNAKFSAKHLTKRKAFYKDAEYPFTITKEVF